MKLRYIAPAVAAATLLLAGTGVAYAQDNQVVDVKVGKACGTVTLTLTNPDVGEYGFNYTTGPFAGGPVGDRGLIVVPSNKTVSHTIRLAEDSFDGQGFVTLGVAYGPNTHKQAFQDLGLVDTDCAPPVTPTTSASASPSVSASASPSASASASPSATPSASADASASAIVTTPAAAPLELDPTDFTQTGSGDIPVSIDTGRA